MAATIQTIETPKRWRAWDTSGNNNHGQIYSGRALEFDGVSDYLTVGDSTSLQLTSGATFSAWINTNTVAKDTKILAKPVGGSGTTSSYQIRTDTSGGLLYQIYVSGAWRTITSTPPIAVNTWYRLVATHDSSNNVVIYLNGVSHTTGDIGYAIPSSTGDLHIGARRGETDEYFDGKMSDLQIWDAAWTADDVAFDYANPEQLALNRGGTSLTESNLKIWYPMNDGHRGQQSYVLDASNTGLGDEILTNGDFNAEDIASLTDVNDITGWTNMALTGTGNTYKVVNGQFEMNVDDAGGNVWIRQASLMTVGVTYKISFEVISSVGDLEIVFEKSAGGVFYSTKTLGTHTFYFNSDVANFTIRKGSSQTGTIVIDNFSCKPVNDKNHATTVFYGDELWDGADDSVTNWVASSGTVSSEVASADCIKIIPGSSTTSSTIQLRDSKDLNTDLTIGRTYRVQADVATDVVSAGANSQFGVYDGTSYNYDSTPITTATNLVTNGTMEADSNWSNAGSPSTQQRNSFEHNGDYSRRFTPDAANEGIISDAFTTVISTQYLATAWVYPDDGTTVTMKLLEGDGATVQTKNITGLTENAWNQVAEQFIDASGGSGAKIQFDSGSSTSGDWYIDDVVVTAFQSKTLEFVADDEQDNYLANVQTHEDEFLKTDTANNQTFNADEGDWIGVGATSATWGAAFGATGSDGGLQVVGDGSSSLQGAKLQYGHWGSTIQLGRSYIVQMDIKGASGELDNFKFGLGAHYTSAFTVTTSFATYQAILTPTTTTNSLFVYRSGTTGETDPWYFDNVSVKALQNTWIDNISVKEVGTATGWTDADQQLDIPQTALQSYNQLLWFNGAGTNTSDTSVVRMADHSNLDVGTNDFSLSCWVYKNLSNNDSYEYIARKGGANALGWAMAFNDDDKISLNISGSGSNNLWSYYGTAITAGEWNHFVGTWNRGGSTNIYINGESVTVSGNTDISALSAQTMNNSNNLYIGGDDDAPATLAFEGCITEISFWKSHILSQSDVNELYNDGKALNVLVHSAYTANNARLAGYWRNNGLATWSNLKVPGTNDSTLVQSSETILQQAGVDASRDCQGFLMNRQKDTNALNPIYANVSDGTDNNLVDVKDSSTLDITSDFTLACWVKIRSWDQSWNLIQKKDAWNTNGYGMYINTNKKVYFEYASNDGSANHQMNSTPTIDTLDTWYYVAVTHKDGTRDRIYVGINTAASLTQTEDSSTGADNAVLSAVGTNDLSLTVGSSTGGDDNYPYRHIDGFIDETTVYSKELSEDEINRNFKAGKRSHR